jgi:hypothetical protein
MSFLPSLFINLFLSTFIFLLSRFPPIVLHN